MAAVLLQIGIIYFLGHFFAFTFVKYKIPDVLLFMLLGIVIGPGLSLAYPSDFGQAGAVLSTMALLVILFQSGVTLNFKSLAEVAGIGILITMLTAIITVALVFALSYPFTQSWKISLLTGIILLGTSSAVVIPMSQALRLSEKAQNILLLESAATDVLCIVLTLGFAKAFAGGKGIELGGLAGQVIISFLLAMLIGLMAGAIWSHFKTKMRSLATVAMVMALYGLVELIGFSGPIAVMSMGFALANTAKFTKNFYSIGLTETENEFYSELSFILKTFFFIFLGISIKFNSALMMAAGVALTLGVLFCRKFLTMFLLKKHANTLEKNYITLLIPKGLAAAVLAEIPAQMGIEGAQIIPQFVYAVVFTSILIVSVLIPWLGFKYSNSSRA